MPAKYEGRQVRKNIETAQLDISEEVSPSKKAMSQADIAAATQVIKDILSPTSDLEIKDEETLRLQQDSLSEDFKLIERYLSE